MAGRPDTRQEGLRRERREVAGASRKEKALLKIVGRVVYGAGLYRSIKKI